jgi:hypothetical protein
VRWDGTQFTLFSKANSPLPANFVSGVDVRPDGLLAVAATDDVNNSGISLIEGDPSVPGNWTVYRYGSSPLAHWQLGRTVFDAHGDLWISCLSMGVVILRAQDPADVAQDNPASPRVELSFAAPNPFSTSTVLRYSLQQGGPVLFEIFDVHGRKIRTLAQGDQGAGDHSVSWNGVDDERRLVPSGLYFGRLRSGAGEKTLRLVRTE